MTVFDKKILQNVTRPVAEARGLPNSFYTDPDTYQLEQRKVMAATWAGLSFASYVPEAGDAMPITFCGSPLIIARGDDNQVRVFLNACRHRGMILLEEKRKIEGALRCPYHSWCYDLKGRLRATPHVGGPGQNAHEDIRRDELGLTEIRSRVWRDVIFVNMDGKAPSFDEHASTLIGRWKEFDQPMVHGGPDSGFKLNLKTNWKLAVENYCESYHLPWIHPGLNAYSRLEDHYDIVEPDMFSGQGTVVYNPSLSDDGRKFANFQGLSRKWDTGAEYISFFPNVLFGVHRDHAFAILLESTGPQTTTEHIELYYANDDMCGPAYADMREKNAAMWKEIFIEDIGVVEGMQKGRQGDLFDGGKFSPAMDAPTHCFHDWVARRFEAV